MNKFFEYTQNAVDYAKPYVKEVGGYAADAAGFVGNKIRKNTKRAKRKMRILKIKNILDVVSNVVLIIAAVVALFVAVSEYLKSKEI